MKIAISNIAWDSSEDNVIATLLQKYNIRGIEIAPTKVWKDPVTLNDKDIALYKKYWNDKHISIVAMQSLLYGHPELIIFGTAEKRRALVSYLRKIIYIAAALGVQAMVFGSPKNRVIGNLKKEDAYEIAIDFFREIGDIAKEYNVRFCIESNPQKYGTDFLTNTEEVIDFIKTLNHPYVNTHLDSGAMKINNENYAETIITSQPFSHFHISEEDLIQVPHDVDHIMIAKTLKSIHYNKWVSIEMRQLNNHDNSEQIEKTLAFVTKLYQ